MRMDSEPRRYSTTTHFRWRRRPATIPAQLIQLGARSALLDRRKISICLNTSTRLPHKAVLSSLISFAPAVLAVKMPVDSPYDKIDIPNIGIWDLIFERKNRPFPDDQGTFTKHPSHQDFNQFRTPQLKL